MQCSLVAKRIGNEWESALIVDGKFHRAFNTPTLTEAVSRGLNPLFGMTYPDDTEVGINVTIEAPKEDPRGPSKIEG